MCGCYWSDSVYKYVQMYKVYIYVCILSIFDIRLVIVKMASGCIDLQDLRGWTHTPPPDNTLVLLSRSLGSVHADGYTANHAIRQIYSIYNSISSASEYVRYEAAVRINCNIRQG